MTANPPSPGPDLSLASYRVPGNVRLLVRSDLWIKISILDNGTGMPESTCKRIFDPFFTTKPIGQETGMRMPISYKIIVEKHGGKLDGCSIPRQGTEFVIKFLSNKRGMDDC